MGFAWRVIWLVWYDGWSCGDTNVICVFQVENISYWLAEGVSGDGLEERSGYIEDPTYNTSSYCFLLWATLLQ